VYLGDLGNLGYFPGAALSPNILEYLNFLLLAEVIIEQAEMLSKLFQVITLLNGLNKFIKLCFQIVPLAKLFHFLGINLNQNGVVPNIEL
jgi:hypothetical protein